jgi:cell division transport system ATP-binding protein
MEALNHNPIIRMFHVHKQFGPHHALSDISLDIKKNEFICITGPSGAGKTTLLKLLYLGEKISEGQILVDGLNLSRISRRHIPKLRRKFGIIFQDFKLLPNKTVFENIAVVLEATEEKRSFIPKKVKSVLRTIGMEDRQKALPPSLSGGEQQRIAVARAIVSNPKIILADEPTGSLDPVSAGIIIDLLKRFHGRGATVIVATHDNSLLNSIEGRNAHLDRGRLRTISSNAS